ncbi:MAG TPA: SDR family oxidoreductase [Segetibacter sp.]|jgi:dTDP-4-dehydrorhamnose reductase
MKILVTGANGFLGQHLCLHLADKGLDVVATSRGNCRIPSNEKIIYEDVELTNKEAVAAMLANHTPDVIVHTAAMSKPDECNNNTELAIDVNVTATINLLQSPGAHFIYISTDFIFGEDGPHSEDEAPEPLNFYGETKLMAEEEVKNSGVQYAIVRPVFIYGKTWDGLRPTFLHWVKNNLEQEKSIKVVSDQLRTPTYVLDICKGIYSIIENKATGDFHFAGKDLLSPYDMAVTTAKTLGLDASLIENVTSDTFPEPVKRAKRSGLKIDKAIKELDYNPVSFEEGVGLTFTS